MTFKTDLVESEHLADVLRDEHDVSAVVEQQHEATQGLHVLAV